MEVKFEEYLKINLENLKAPDYFKQAEKERFKNSVIMLMEIGKLITKCIIISQNVEMPLMLKEQLNNLVDDFLFFYNLLNGIRQPSTEQQKITNAFDRIHAEHASFFEITSSSNKKMMVINAIANYENNLDAESFKKRDLLNKELEEKNKKVDNILKKLENPSAQKVLQDYAREYMEEEHSNNSKSTRWLIGGGSILALFIMLVLLSIFNEWFPTKLTLNDMDGHLLSSHEIINIPVLVTKVMLISLLIYVILFCFKQYSIYKHLAVVNQQKKNAFNSYVLFDAAIGDGDSEAKRALLMSLAKTIHESVNTGFLSSKSFEQPLIQSVEMGKFNADIK